MERDFEKDIIELDAAIKSNAERDNTFTLSVLQRVKAIMLQQKEKLKAYEDTGLTPEEILGRKMLAGWIPVEERLPKRKEWIVTDGEEHYLRRLEVAVASDTLEYFFVFYDGYKWFDKFGRTYGNVVAWKIHEPLNPQN